MGRIIICGGNALSQSIKSVDYGFRMAGWESLHIPTRLASGKGGPAVNLYEMIASTVKGFQPDMLMWCICKKDYKPGILAEAKKKKADLITVFQSVDDPFHSDGNNHTDAAEFDFAVTCCEKSIADYERLGTPAMLAYPPPHDFFYFNSVVSKREQCDFCFVGTNVYPKKRYPHVLLSRYEIIDTVAPLGKVHIYGPHDEHRLDWQGFNQDSVVLRGWRSCEELPHIYRSAKINLCSHVRPDGYKYINERLITTMAAGGFILTDHVNGIEEVFEVGGELDTWKTADELKEKAAYWLSHDREREKVAKAGQEAIRLEHSGQRLAEKIMDFVGSE